MRIRRTIPPAASKITFRDLLEGVHGIINGNSGRAIEEGISEYFGMRHVFLVSSGKAALSVILMAMKEISGKRKVIIPAYTCYSVPAAVGVADLETVPCDLDPETLDYDFEDLEKKMDDDTLCVVSTHLFGIPSDVRRIREIGGKRGIFVVEDAAQAMGAVKGEGKLGTFGDAAFFSLGRGKNITCVSGGIILTDSEIIGKCIEKKYMTLEKEPAGEYLKSIMEAVFIKIFMNPYMYWIPDGIPFLNIGKTVYPAGFPIYKLNGFKAGMLRKWKNRMETGNKARSDNGRYYISELKLDNRKFIYSDNHCYLRLPVFLKRNDQKETLCASYRHLGISPMYPDSINNIPDLKRRFAGMQFASSEKIAGTIITIPTHELVNDGDKKEICDVIKKIEIKESLA